jgi:hypothetical protein
MAGLDNWIIANNHGGGPSVAMILAAATITGNGPGTQWSWCGNNLWHGPGAAMMAIVLVNLLHPVSHHGHGSGGSCGRGHGRERIGSNMVGHRTYWDSHREGQLLVRSDLNKKKKKRKRKKETCHQPALASERGRCHGVQRVLAAWQKDCGAIVTNSKSSMREKKNYAKGVGVSSNRPGFNQVELVHD